MDDTMKESKVGGKKHGMVLIISVGKKGDKDPTHAADPDTKKKALPIPPEVLQTGLLAGLGGAAVGHFMAWLTNRMDARSTAGYTQTEEGWKRNE